MRNFDPMTSGNGRAGARLGRGFGLSAQVLARLALAALVPVLLGAGCVSKRKAEMEARQAYWAGQQQASQTQSNSFSVSVQGRVRNHLIPWTTDLTLARAIVEANYIGLFNPKVIRVTRNGQTVEVSPNDLLKGSDMPMEAGDLVQIVD